jgi:hypothetical protein
LPRELFPLWLGRQSDSPSAWHRGGGGSSVYVQSAGYDIPRLVGVPGAHKSLMELRGNQYWKYVMHQVDSSTGQSHSGRGYDTPLYDSQRGLFMFNNVAPTHQDVCVVIVCKFKTRDRHVVERCAAGGHHRAAIVLACENVLRYVSPAPADCRITSTFLERHRKRDHENETPHTTTCTWWIWMIRSVQHDGETVHRLITSAEDKTWVERCGVTGARDNQWTFGGTASWIAAGWVHTSELETITNHVRGDDASLSNVDTAEVKRCVLQARSYGQEKPKLLKNHSYGVKNMNKEEQRLTAYFLAAFITGLFIIPCFVFSMYLFATAPVTTQTSVA